MNKLNSKITLVSGCFNESENIGELYSRVLEIFNKFKNYEFDYIIIDNASTDATRDILRQIAFKDKRIKLIFNTRNFGHIRSPYWGILQASGDAVVYLASDLQDPPELIEEFISYWEDGYKVVLGVKPESETNKIFHFLRKSYYNVLSKISDVELTKNTTGFGLYDKSVIQEIKKINDPYPYLRGIVDEIGYKIKTIPFVQPQRKRGITKNNIFTLYDIAVLGITSHSKTPLRIAAVLGFFMSVLAIFLALLLFIFKIIWWDNFVAGLAPIGITILLLFGILFAVIGVLGEYTISIQRYVSNRPIVVEEERVNFDDK